ncbi:MAG: site-2 protease family protein [Chloroflexi bacterium]|jgi:membrane-associated protease RseP (regulator of RpoE activity)|nr:site-2 protease family protein [Chloroflexota bacterium]
MGAVAPKQQPSTDEFAWVRSLVEGVLIVEDITVGVENTQTIRVRGRFVATVGDAYARMAAQARARGYTLRLRQQGEEAIILLDPGVTIASTGPRWLPAVLAGVTVLSVLAAYMVYWGLEEFTWAAFLSSLPEGLGFAASLLAILTAHELAHYFTARHFRVPVTLPYFIPMPFSPLGTMGAVISMRGVPPSKRATLLIGLAGPVAGLVVAIPVLLYGLHLSEVAYIPQGQPYSVEGNSLLYLALKYVMFGRWLPSGNLDVLLHPVAFAGWGGLLVTGLNLIPAGQLDGGHVAYALLGEKTRYLNWAIIAALLVLGIWWSGWFLWAALIFMFSRFRVRPLDDVSPLKRAEVIAGVLLLIVFVITFVPVPLKFVM